MAIATRHALAQAKWDNLAATWVDTGPPASPSTQDIANYRMLLEQALGHRRTGNLVILGSTPKLRDLLASEPFLGFNVLCVDFSAKMYTQMSAAVGHPNPRETFHLEDWCTFRAAGAEYDAILGDKCIDNVMPEDWDAFFSNVHYHLRPGGAFIVHLALADSRFQGVPLRDALAKWSDRLHSKQDSLRNAAAGFWEDLLTASAFKNGYHNTVTTSRFADEVEEALSHEAELDTHAQQLLHEFFRVFWPSRDDLWSSYQYAEIIERMSPYFFHERTLYSADYDVAPVQPLVLMRARSRPLHS